MKSFTKIILAFIILTVAVIAIQTNLGIKSQGNHNQSSNQTEQSGAIPPYIVKDVAMLNLNGKSLVIVTFELPTPCHNVTLKSTEIKKNDINLFFEFITPKNPCIQVIKQYNQTVSLGKLKSGKYTLNIFINGKEVWSREFEV
ncbi:hypothetical protein DRP05_07505 [Archaeoglobales archaeon]|nr:MAG: hypothetical protein DRP05_07505 [Archaeoglobales archaeon]